MGIGLSDAQGLLPEHGNGELLAEPLHMCVQENRKFRQSISTASKAGSAALGCGYTESCGDGKRMQRLGLPLGRGSGERPPAACVGWGGGEEVAAQGLIHTHTHGLHGAQAG